MKTETLRRNTWRLAQKLERIPAKVYIVHTVRHKIISKSNITDKHPEERKILTPALPLVPVSKCIAGASVLADITTGKFMYHLPFYRQIQHYKEAGITISDSQWANCRGCVQSDGNEAYDQFEKVEGL